MIFIGAVLVLSQTFTTSPYQPAIALGVLLVLAGMVRRVDAAAPAGGSQPAPGGSDRFPI